MGSFDGFDFTRALRVESAAESSPQRADGIDAGGAPNGKEAGDHMGSSREFTVES